MERLNGLVPEEKLIMLEKILNQHSHLNEFPLLLAWGIFLCKQNLRKDILQFPSTENLVSISTKFSIQKKGIYHLYDNISLLAIYAFLLSHFLYPARKLPLPFLLLYLYSEMLQMHLHHTDILFLLPLASYSA